MPSILIVESNKLLCDTLAEAFSLQGCQVSQARAAVQGPALAQAQQPTVIICELPYGTDYREVLAAWTAFQQRQPTPLYLLTTDAAAPYRLAAIVPPHTRVITKPFNPVELLQICQHDMVSNYAAV